MSSQTPSSANSDRYIDAGDARLRYRDEGSGPPLLLLHGWTLDLDMWDPQVEELAGSHRLIRFDRRGFGLSSGQPSLASDVGDARRLCLQLGIERTAVLGMSQGARVALQLAASAPRLISCLILDGPPGLSTNESTDVPLTDLREILRTRGIEALRQVWRRNPLATLRTPDPRMHALLDRMIARYSGGDLATASLSVPLLVLNGDHDLKTRLRAGQALSQSVPSAEHALIPEAGHLPNLDNPRAYNDTIRSFLARHPPMERPQ
jgi:pimeloyl-ACP methyl ester carboxylesterase